MDNQDTVTEGIREGREWNEKKEQEKDDEDDVKGASGSYNPNRYR